jgi:hypothetical protein
MNKEFIPYKLALELKELGFDEPCLGIHYNEGLNPSFIVASQYGEHGAAANGGILAPLYQQAFRWFREKYNLVHEISWSKYKGGASFDYDIFSLVLPTDDELGNEDDIYIEKPMETYDSLAEKSFRDRESDSFEEAELECLKKLIKIVKENGFNKNIH